MIPASVIACAISAAISAAGAYQWQAYRYEARMAALVAEYAQAQHKAVEYAHAETIRLQERKDKAEVQAARRVRAAAADRDLLHGAVERLRNDIATSGNNATDTGEPPAPTMQQPPESYQQSALKLLQRWRAMLMGGVTRP